MISLLEQYVTVLNNAGRHSAVEKDEYHYEIPSDSVSADEWAEFDNVFQIHCPRIFMDSAIRDVSWSMDVQP